MKMPDASTRKQERPPRLAEWFLHFVIRGEAAEVIGGDLAEEFHARIRAGHTPSQIRAAKWWYRRQVMGSVFARMTRKSERPTPIYESSRKRERVMGTLFQDLRYGIRILTRSPGMTLLAILTLGLGIGANTTVFNWMKATLFEPLPGVQRQDELVSTFRVTNTLPNGSIAYPDFLDIRARAKTVAGIAVHSATSFSLSQDGHADLVFAETVSENFFDMLQVAPQLGRGFSSEEGKSGAPHVVVISDGLWNTHYGRDPQIVEKEIVLDGSKATVIGVAPPNFAGAEPALRFDLWIPVIANEEMAGTSTRLTARGNHWLSMMARRSPGTSVKQVNADLAKIADDLARAYPANDRGASIVAYPIWKAPSGAASILGPVLMVLMALAGVVLLIACANVANLMLSRAIGRRREMAIRLSLGASRLRIVRQLLMEGTLLSLGGAIVALAIARLTGGLLVALVPPTGLPVSMTAQLDWKLVGFTLAISVAAAIIFGLAPALQSSHAEPAIALREEATTQMGGRGGWMRSALVVVQVALSVITLVSAGLFLRSLNKAQSFDPGFNPRNVVMASAALFPGRYNAAAGRDFYRRAVQRLEALPGVQSATLLRRVPLGFGGTSSSDVVIEGYTPSHPDEEVWGYANWCGPRFAETLQIPLVAGRDFNSGDTYGKPGVLIVNRAMAAKYWKNGDAIGKRVQYAGDWLTVVGIVENSKMRDLKEKPAPTYYFSVDQYYRRDMTYLIRTRGNSQATVVDMRTTLQLLDSDLAIFNLTTLETTIGAATFQSKLGGTLLGAFGALALTLAAVGIFGVMAYSVSQRTREIGIRVALGATRGRILRLVVGDGMLLLAIGLVVGIAGAVGVSRALASFLFGISPLDPITFGIVPVLLAAVAILACWLPAMRATRVDPMVALRYE
jgi:macrolide transport system ATP-binding/permease protein